MGEWVQIAYIIENSNKNAITSILWEDKCGTHHG